MQGQGWPTQLIIHCIIICSAVLCFHDIQGSDQKSESGNPETVSKPTPLQDDSHIHDLKIMGDRYVWAAGDRGAIWKSSDGGKKWVFQKSPADCSWKSICFLTGQRGWIAGSKVQPHTGLPYGVLITTKNGGKTWNTVSANKLPPISFVKFFDLNSGIIIGQSNGTSPSGVLFTEDGGKTWMPIIGKQNQNWLAASFTSPETGIAAGRNGAISLISSNRFLSTSPVNLERRAIHSLVVNRNRSGWLVGDGGLILKTDTGGIDWSSPEKTIPPEARKLFDFYTVATSGEHLWIAGNPGNSVWHSPDQGKSWNRQSTSLTGIISAIAFSSPTHGCAAGSFGTILLTNDSGKTWQTVRAPNRRIAMMGIYSEPQKIPFEFLAKFSKDQGYRSHVLLPIHNKLRPEHRVPENDHLHLESAVISSGGSTTEYGWQFNIDIPGLEYSTNKLMNYWQEQTDFQFREQFLGRLVRDIRNWKPSVIIINQPDNNDAATTILHQAVKLASEQAGNSAYFPEHKLYAFLLPWKVKKVIEKTTSGKTGTIKISTYQYLKHSGDNAFVISSSARSQVTRKKQTSATEIHFNVLQSAIKTKSGNPYSTRVFAGIPVAPGTEARRELIPINEKELEQQLSIARKQKNFRAYTKQYLDNPIHASQVIGQLHQMTKGMSNEQAALQIIQLANTYRQQGNWELYESTLTDLVSRFPHEPISMEGMQDLLHLWTGFEPSFQRIQKYKSYQHNLKQDFDKISSQLEQAIRFSQSNPTQYQLDFQNRRKKSGVQLTSRESSIKIGRSTLKQNRMLHWHQQAFRLADLIRTSFPQVYIKPEIQFPLAKLLREHEQSEFAEHFYHLMQSDPENQSWNTTAAAELWLASSSKQSAKTVYRCDRAGVKPYLDGLLGDECWLNAKLISLTDEEAFNENLKKKTSKNNPQQDHAFAMISYDDDYLYLAYSIPHHAKVTPQKTIEAGRVHDVNLSGFDRIQLDIDVDRDYSTWYSFHTDQRGQTRDACWNNYLWNPKWHVKTVSSETHWRAEIAIPFSELTDNPPIKSTTWAASFVRIIPTVGIESWAHPSTIEPSPSNFGLIRFQ